MSCSAVHPRPRPALPGLRRRDVNRCERLAHGHLEPGLQSGFCESTGGGWSTLMVAHRSQLVDVPDELSDEAAVIVEPTACAVHAAAGTDPGTLAVLGAGTLGLLTIAALRAAHADATILATAKHPQQRTLATELGADRVVEPDELERAVRTMAGSMRYDNGQLGGGVPQVVDCVGSADSIAQALRICAPGGTIHLVGMAGVTTVDLTPLWQREVALRGAYAYTRADFIAPSTWSATVNSAAWSAPPTPCAATRKPSPMRPRLAAAAPSRSPSTSAEKEREVG